VRFGGMAMVTDAQRRALDGNSSRGPLGPRDRYTIDRVIPWRVARQQSPPPFDPAQGG
jgi:hypothetical protein